MKIKHILSGAVVGFVAGLAIISIYKNAVEIHQLKSELQSTVEKKQKLKTELEDVTQENHQLHFSNRLLEHSLGQTMRIDQRLTEGSILKLSRRERDCLMKNVYYEAGVEPLVGKIAVAQVTLNRLKSGRWGNTICKVVYARSQFSWTVRKKHEQPRGILWEETRKAVNLFERGLRLKDIEDSLYYHAEWIKEPRWAKEDYKIAQIGQHIFYKDVNK